jgi:hypothetical protein
MKRLALVTAILLLLAGFASAGPIVPKDIGAGAKWFGHVDFEAIRSMKLVQDLKDKCPVHKQCQAKVEELAKKLGMNPMEDILGATLYSDRYGGQLGVVLVYVKTLNRERMVNCLHEKHPDYKTAEYGSRLLYSWTDGHHGKTMELTGTFASDTLIVIGAGAEQVKSALDVLDGRKPGLGKDSPLIAGIPATALFASRGIDVSEDYRQETRCPVLRNCKAASAIWSVNGEQITGKYEFATESAETAKNFKAIVDGFMALGQLRYSGIPAVKKVMDGLKVEVSGESFTATFTASTSDVEAAIKAVMEQKNPCPLCHKQHGPHEKCEANKK